MSRGGKRVGAGRKPGSALTKTRLIADKTAAEGLTPLEVMIANMRHFQVCAESAEAVISELSTEKLQGAEPEEQFKYLLAEVKKAAGLRDMAQGCARDAAPYIHPRLSSSTVTMNQKRDATDWTRDELVAILNDAGAGGSRTYPANGRDPKPDQVH